MSSIHHLMIYHKVNILSMFHSYRMTIIIILDISDSFHFTWNCCTTSFAFNSNQYKFFTNIESPTNLHQSNITCQYIDSFQLFIFKQSAKYAFQQHDEFYSTGFSNNQELLPMSNNDGHSSSLSKMWQILLCQLPHTRQIQLLRSVCYAIFVLN